MANDDVPSHRDRAALTFWGAAQMVTGSMHLLEVGDTRVLLDCGLYQGRREESRRRNSAFPFSPTTIDAVLISHAHIDHCGNLPTLIRNGFDGPIYCTAATRDLLQVMLYDSAKIQEEDAANLNIQRGYAEPLIEPLYCQTDVRQALAQCVPVDFRVDWKLSSAVRFQFDDAGHVLGSAMIHIVLRGATREHRLTFTGDLGRRGLPLHKATASIPPADVLVCESTYGNRLHEPVQAAVDKLYATIRTTIARGGKVLIPAFSLGRTQLIIHYLQKGVIDGSIPDVPIYVDSPLAADITGVYESHPDCLSDEGREMLEQGTGILGAEYVEYIRDFEDSLRTTMKSYPMVVLAGSGMCDSGRIVQHLKHHVDDPRCTIILVSYQAQGTTGRKLMDPNPTVRFMGRDWNKWIDVVHLEGFSGHADRDDFVAYLGPSVDAIRKVRLIHGEREQAEALAETLRGLGFTDVEVPNPGDTVTFE